MIEAICLAVVIYFIIGKIYEAIDVSRDSDYRREQNLKSTEQLEAKSYELLEKRKQKLKSVERLPLP